MFGLSYYDMLINSTLLKRFQDEAISFVNDGGVEAGKVDLGGRFAVVAHTFADY